jgi:hypothetical protein
MIFKLLLSLGKLSYGTLSVKDFEVLIWNAKIGKLRRLQGNFNFGAKIILQDFVFGYNKKYALFFH